MPEAKILLWANAIVSSTMTDSAEIGEGIHHELGDLALEVLERHYSRRPDLERRYGTRGRELCLQDIRYHLSYLSEALSSRSPQLFTDYVEWAAVLLRSQGTPQEDLEENLGIIHEVLKERLPHGEEILCEYLDPAVESVSRPTPLPESSLREEGTLRPLAEEYLEILLKGERDRAMDLIVGRVEEGTSIEEIYLGVFQPCLHEVGRLWQINEITVAQEHFFTASTQLIMSRLYPYMFRGPREGPSALATTVSGELHEIGVRMVTDLLEMRGWDTYFLGSNTPVNGLIESIRSFDIDVLLLSATISYHVGEVRRVIDEVRRSKGCENTRIMVGGRPFNVDHDLWAKVGADAYALDGRQAIQVAGELVR